MSKERLRYCPVCGELFQFTKIIANMPYLGHVCKDLEDRFGDPMILWWNGLDLYLVTRLSEPPPKHESERG